MIKRTLRKLNSFAKGLILFSRIGLLFSFLAKPFYFFSNLISLSQWISKQNNKDILDDFYQPFRDHSKRMQLYEYIAEKHDLTNTPIDYLEFGVYTGTSFNWWLQKNSNPESKFYGFDTFEGLPENWGTYSAGDMHASVPNTNDQRAKFGQGLFQETLFGFLNTHTIGKNRMIIHIDADLFTSTVFALTTLARYLKKDDIIIFDEFNVPNHEFSAFKILVESFYIKYELLGAVNNYYQIAVKII